MEKINKNNFNELVINSKNLVVLDFYADWCRPCRMFAPVFEGVSEKYSDVNFYKVNVDENNELAHNYQVTSIPSTIFIKDGTVKDKVLGFIPEDTLIELIEKFK